MGDTIEPIKLKYHFLIFFEIMEQELIKIFEQVDGDKNKQLSKKELEAALKLISEKLDTSSSLYFLLAGVDMKDIEKIARKAFNEIDQDRNGTITFEEFADSDWALNL